VLSILGSRRGRQERKYSMRPLRTTLLVFLVGLCLVAGPVFPASPTAADGQVKLTAPDGSAADFFGTLVAVSGDTAVVGSPHARVGAFPHAGAAYVYTRVGGIWTQQARLTASDGAAADWFGWSVAISGDTIVVGAWWHDSGTNPDQGSAYVFTRTGTTWSEQAKLTASDGARLDQFGYSVGVSGDTVVVGASPWEDEANVEGQRQGSAYVFARTGNTWVEQAKLTPSAGFAGDKFGVRVALDGDTAVVGAGSDNAAQGSAYVYTRAGTTWTEQAKLTAADGAADDEFGFWVAVSGDTVVVGAYFDDVAYKDQGSAYVFTRSGGTWTEQARLIAADGAEGDLFGRSVAVSGDTIVVGAQYDEIGGNFHQGSASLFTRAGGIWTEKAKLTAADGNASDLFGVSVGVSGNVAIVGANTADVGVMPSQGAAYVFGGSLAQAPPATGGIGRNS
jgi:hypothetical protein